MLAASGKGKEAVPGYDRQEGDGKGGQKIKLVHCKYFCATCCYTCVCIGSESGSSSETSTVNVLPTREGVLIIDEVLVISEVIFVV